MAALSIFIGSVLYPACGEWVDLPQPEEELTGIIAEIQRETDCEEVMISDYEGDWNIGEYDGIFELNELAETLADLNDYERELVETLIRERGDDIEEAIDTIQCGNYRVYGDCYDMSDVAREILCESGDFDSIPDYLQNYFDFEAYGRDLDINGNFYDMGDGRFLEIW